MAATLLNADEGRLMQLPPLLGPDFDVPRQTLAVEPGLAAVDVAHVEEVSVGRIFRAAVAADDEDVVLGRHGDGDGVVQRGRSSVRPPVHGVDADEAELPSSTAVRNIKNTFRIYIFS